MYSLTSKRGLWVSDFRDWCRARLRGSCFCDAVIDRFFRPFLAGVFLDPTLSVSSRAFEFCFRAFVAGDTR
jgi:hypothetical protein